MSQNGLVTVQNRTRFNLVTLFFTCVPFADLFHQRGRIEYHAGNEHDEVRAGAEFLHRIVGREDAANTDEREARAVRRARPAEQVV